MSEVTEKFVYLLVGQRGAGKSTYAERLLANQPEFSIVSRDAILVRKFGSVHNSPYGGEHLYAEEIMHRLLRLKIGRSTSIKMILDCWTGGDRDRISLIRRLRQYGAIRVVAIYFLTPLEMVNSWFWLKPGIAKIEEMKTRKGEKLVYFCPDTPKEEYDAFHRFARGIDFNGFDEVIRVYDPRGEVVVLA